MNSTVMETLQEWSHLDRENCLIAIGLTSGVKLLVHPVSFAEDYMVCQVSESYARAIPITAIEEFHNVTGSPDHKMKSAG